MVAHFAPTDLSTGSAARILLAYLCAGSAIRWPGADGLTQEDVLSFYPRALRVGEVPDRDELCRRHGDLSKEIDVLFARNGWRER